MEDPWELIPAIQDKEDTLTVLGLELSENISSYFVIPARKKVGNRSCYLDGRVTEMDVHDEIKLWKEFSRFPFLADVPCEGGSTRSRRSFDQDHLPLLLVELEQVLKFYFVALLEYLPNPPLHCQPHHLSNCRPSLR